jgi:hypothetical protein
MVNQIINGRSVDELVDEHVTYEHGDLVYVISSSFSPIMQTGVVEYNNGSYNTVAVRFQTDPYSDDTDSRVIDVDPDEMCHCDADNIEVLSFIGREDLIERDDFDQ